MANDSELDGRLNAAAKAEANVDRAAEASSSARESTFDALRNAKSGLEEYEEAVEASSAENQAAEATAKGGYVSVGDALKLMDEEKAAKAEYRAKASAYMSEAVNALGTTISTGTKELLGAAEDTLGNAVDSMTSGSGIAMAAAGGLAALVLPSAVVEPARDMLASWLDLKDNNETDAEEKAVDGCGTAEEFAESALEDNADNGYEPDGTGTDAAGDNEPEYGEDDGADTDAFDMTEEEQSVIANIGKTVITDVAKEALESYQEGGLAAAVATAAVKLAENYKKGDNPEYDAFKDAADKAAGNDGKDADDEYDIPDAP